MSNLDFVVLSKMPNIHFGCLNVQALGKQSESFSSAYLISLDKVKQCMNISGIWMWRGFALTSHFLCIGEMVSHSEKLWSRRIILANGSSENECTESSLAFTSPRFAFIKGGANAMRSTTKSTSSNYSYS